MDNPTLATATQLATILGVNDRTVARWIASGKLKPVGTWTPANGRTVTLYPVIP